MRHCRYCLLRWRHRPLSILLAFMHFMYSVMTCLHSPVKHCQSGSAPVRLGSRLHGRRTFMIQRKRATVGRRDGEARVGRRTAERHDDDAVAMLVARRKATCTAAAQVVFVLLARDGGGTCMQRARQQSRVRPAATAPILNISP